jgi:hypothetical protein
MICWQPAWAAAFGAALLQEVRLLCCLVLRLAKSLYGFLYQTNTLIQPTASHTLASSKPA